MIKKLWGVLTGVLALNFLVVAGGVGYLVATHRLDRDKVRTIRTLIVGDAATRPASQPSTRPATQQSADDAPMLRLDALLARVRDRPAPEQIDFVRGQLDAQAATIERRRREVEDQRQQLAGVQSDLKKQQETLAADRTALDAARAERDRLAADAGFQKTLDLYAAMPAKQVKSLLAACDDDTVVRYLQSFDARQAGSVLKEFKTPAETTRAQGLLEKMRRAQAKAD